ncbi:LON peptidase substrate-binding domain-containing protein [Roseomonas sp. OT10]|uniref:LON peptidase substrate-binding domain-containing protein n=1 Tax=Roseomonas cutis TaxID=2897332 RepID=UPI001E335B82|nr:LON peptidase substrate-binding domain-containing protein [Roseomonas sp. OT10]UFN49192.1 LON peptidase substrate-binding domain-containing protein [Roseomonas sp. OT10]
MAAFHPRLESLPAEIAVFPLTGALLLPQGRLPLNIFEPRYLALVQDSLGQGRMFGMIQPDPAQAEVQTGDQRGTGTRRVQPALYRVGCLGRISSFAETEDGRLLITLTGVARFRVAEELPLRGGYRQVRADYAGWEEDLAVDRSPPPLDRAAVLGALRPYFRARRIEANWEALEQMADSMLVTTLAMVCPFDPREKQALLEAATEEERARVLVTLLQMDALAGPDAPGGPGLPS